MSFIGNTPTSQSFISGTDYFNGTGSQTAFTLTRAVNSVNDISVVINNVVQQPNTAYTISGTTITFTSAPSSGTANIYVRYLSTGTQTITPSAGTVGLSQLNSDLQSKVGIGFKNRIINGAMTIDQRNAGASVTPTANGYTVDRWAAVITTPSKFSVQQNAGSVTPPAGFTKYLGATSLSAYSVAAADYLLLVQVIEGFNIADLAWGTTNAKPVTLSFWVQSSLTGTFGGSINNAALNRSYPFSYSIPVANTWTQISITIAGDMTGTWATDNTAGMRVYFSLGTGTTNSGTAGAWAGTLYVSATGATSVVGTSGATFYITGVQLEVGTTATQFDYRAYGTELALCQRYYEDRSTGDVSMMGFAYTAGALNTPVQFIVDKRSAPTLLRYGVYTAYVNGGNTMTYTSYTAGTKSANISWSATTGITAGQAFSWSSGATPQIAFSAEL